MIILDTHAWLWWLHEPKRLGTAGRRRITAAIKRDAVVVSAISVWEVALKVRLGKLVLQMEMDAWFEAARRYRGIEIAPLTADDAIESTRLPGTFHRDPADQMIVALARRHGAPLITRDRRIAAYPHVQTLW